MDETVHRTAGDLALLTTEQMYLADRSAIEAGIPGISLMDNAGRACAHAVVERFPAGRVLVLCGPGNNGGDGFVIARLLAESGWTVRVALLGERAALSGDAATAASLWAGDVEPIAKVTFNDLDLVVDAVFGAGLARPVDGTLGTLIAQLAQSGVPVCAVDIPTGVEGDTGARLGVAVRASMTVTFFRKKPGHVLYPGRGLCGDIVVADIGIPAQVLDEIVPSYAENGVGLWGRHFPGPAEMGHKYDRGHAMVVSGGAAHTGAARLGARAALRTGAGLVSVASPLDAVLVNAAHLTTIMIKPFDGPAALSRLLEDRRFNAVLVGPAAGVGGTTRSNTRVALASPAACVLDADALTSFSDRPEDLFGAVAQRNGRPVVLTPHGGEFARLFADLANAGNRIESAVKAAQRSNTVIVLKGADTVIAAPDGQAVVNTNAPPVLATAGSGDVLGGVITGLLAQGMPGFDAACAAVWLHGEVGTLGGPGLIAEDLPDLLPQVLRPLAGFL